MMETSAVQPWAAPRRGLRRFATRVG